MSGTAKDEVKKNKPKRAGSGRWLVLALLFFVLVLLTVFFTSSLSRVQSFEVSGNQLVSEQAILEATEVKVGDQYLFTNPADVKERIEQMGSMEEVKVTKEFPGLIRIAVKEYPTVAFIVSKTGARSAVLSSGKRLRVAADTMITAPVLTGWSDPESAKRLTPLTEALTKVNRVLLNDFSEIVPIPSNAYPDKIKIYTRSGFEVLTTIGKFESKMKELPGMMEDQRKIGNNNGYLNMFETNYHSEVKLD